MSGRSGHKKWLLLPLLSSKQEAFFIKNGKHENEQQFF